MKVGVFSSKSYDKTFFTRTSGPAECELSFIESHLCPETVSLARGYEHVCVFVNDTLNKDVIEQLATFGVKHIALRCAGFNNVDINAARAAGIRVSRVPAYSPEAVAEHTVALMLALNRKTHKAYNRVKENNFNLEGLMGFNFYRKTCGIVGTGKIGQAVARIMTGFGCRVLCVDPYTSDALVTLGCEYTDMDTLLGESDIITLHCPLTEQNQHMIGVNSIRRMKRGVMLINTSRGALVDTKAVIDGLKSRQIGFLGLDVYEMESELFFEDLSCEIIQDDVFERLAGFPNVLVTGHQGFFTEDALGQIADVTLKNIGMVDDGQSEGDTFLC